MIDDRLFGSSRLPVRRTQIGHSSQFSLVPSVAARVCPVSIQTAGYLTWTDARRIHGAFFLSIQNIPPVTARRDDQVGLPPSPIIPISACKQMA